MMFMSRTQCELKKHSWGVLACRPCRFAFLLIAQLSLWLHCGLLASLSQENSKPLLAHLCSSAYASLRQADCLLTKHTNASCLSRSKGASNYNSRNYWSVSSSHSHCHTPSAWTSVCLIITRDGSSRASPSWRTARLVPHSLCLCVARTIVSLL